MGAEDMATVRHRFQMPTRTYPSAPSQSWAVGLGRVRLGRLNLGEIEHFQVAAIGAAVCVDEPISLRHLGQLTEEQLRSP